MFDISRRVVMITGSVGNLGQAVAEALVAMGARTVLVDRSQDRLSEAFPKLTNNADHLLVGGVDLLSAESVSNCVAKAVARFDRIDALVHTVGGFRGGKSVAEESLEAWDSLFNLNVRTTLLACRAVIPAMRRQRSGRIVTVGSRAALQGGAGLAAYCAAKSAVLRMTESMAAELAPEGINVNCVLPGTLDTPQNRAAMPDADSTTWVRPANVARVVAFLVSDLAQAVRGVAIPL
ncbi:MAG TPA: SDR family NAD(P)-dependent oxidoreductase [Phycisphaerae bacterium]|nr:SDR family NAD(P)-dependent oxidoreductase [Phycisphaerae bacterium]